MQAARACRRDAGTRLAADTRMHRLSHRASVAGDSRHISRHNDRSMATHDGEAGAEHGHDHVHDGAHDHEHARSELSEMDLRVRALESLLVEKGYVDPVALDLLIETYETRI